jgi:methionyl-tRNA formyltransferase
VSEHMAGRNPLRVVVLTCAGLGLETAVELETIPGIEVVAVLDSPYRPMPWRRKLRKLWRARGADGLISLAATRISKTARQLFRKQSAPEDVLALRCPVIPVADLHSPESLQHLRVLNPDLGVIDGTYILRPEVFNVPRYGCINLHCGRVPEYRGSPPAFWELYDGVDEVGITIHQVTAQLDEGPVFLEQSLRLDVAPAGDPARYVEAYWRDTLRPRGIDLLKQTVAAIRDGRARPTPQRTNGVRTHRSPTRHDIRELRRRVQRRRQERE